MSAESSDIEARLARLQRALASDRHPCHQLSAGLLADALQWARDALQAGQSEPAVQLLEKLLEIVPAAAPAWALLGFAYGAEQRLPDAVHAFAQATALDPGDAAAARGYAQSCLDAGLAATAAFERAAAVAPSNMATLTGLAAALIAEGRAADAESRLVAALLSQPDWLAGHQQLAELRWTLGDVRGFARSYEGACAAQPQNLTLRLAWFSAVAKSQDWTHALKIVAEGESLLGSRPAFAAARAFIADETGDAVLAEQLFAGLAGRRDPVLGIAHIRHCLKTARWEQAQDLAFELLSGHSAALVWPYLSLIWRLQGDERAQWLDGHPPYIRTYELSLSAGELRDLAACLRRLHTARVPFLEQSVREGTQTDVSRQLFFRAEPEIQHVRAKAREALRDYIAAMPPHVPGHPLLGVARDRIRFSGSWSVRLRGRGFHISHTHPLGWISSALYVSMPEPEARGAPPAGWIRFGSPPPALGLTLPAYRDIEPKAGQLVLFPSTLWHETLPFEAGERLVIAFDVMRPGTRART